LGALLSAGLAVGLREPVGRMDAAAVVVACGIVGYGVSLRLYLLAQRRLGAGRAASGFASAPVAGGGVRWGFEGRAATPALVAGAALMAAGVALHATEGPAVAPPVAP